MLWRGVRRGDQAGPPAGRVVFTAAWPLLCVVLGIGLLKAYQHVTYHPRYFQDMGARTVWHNALMGLWVNDHLAGKYQLRVNDRVVIAAVRNFLRESHDPRLTPEWTDSAVLGALGGHSTFNWFTYEKAAKDLYWHIWRADTRDMLHCYLIDKPREIVDVLVAASSPDRRFTRDIRGLGFRPLAPAPLLLALPGLLLVAAGNVGLTTVTVATLFLLACSLAPGVLFYPVVHTMVGSFATISLAVYAALAQAASIAIRWVWR